MDWLRFLRLIALRNVVVGRDQSAHWRKVARWYSKTFATPLHVVDELPEFDVWQAYLEDRADGLDDAEIHKEIEDVLNPNSELEQGLQKSLDNAALDKLVEETKKQNKVNSANKRKPKAPKEVVERIDESLLDSIEGIGNSIDTIKKALSNPEGFSLDFSEFNDPT